MICKASVLRLYVVLSTKGKKLIEIKIQLAEIGNSAATNYPELILGNSNPWKRSHYIILSEIIKEDLSKREELQNERKFELGTSISHITLQRFFESDYHYKKHSDLRFLKTLDKICIFGDLQT